MIISKKTLSIQAVLMAFASMAAQTNSQNYVKTVVPLDAANNSRMTAVQYYDGLGRPTVQATNAVGNGNRYIHSLTEYDTGDRVSKQYIAATSSSSNYTSLSGLTWPYSDSRSYTANTYDALDRLVRSEGPGDLWAGHPQTTAYTLNTANEVRLYTITGNSLRLTGSYDAGKLTKESVTDEDGHTVTTFKDMQDRIVLERHQENNDTYMVYDLAGNLRYVLPPKASEALVTTGSTWNISTNIVLQQYAYYYEYDSRARCTKKQLPGCEYMTMAYDNADRLVATQDGCQRQTGSSTYYVYDHLGRQTEMGTQNADGTKVPLIEIFYDDYSFLSASESQLLCFSILEGYDIIQASAKGLPTGRRVHRLDLPGSYTTSAIYYDAKGRVTQERSTNNLGGQDDVFLEYTFTGKEAHRKKIHSAAGMPTLMEIYTYTYGNADQLASVTHSLNGSTPVNIASYTYDDLGRVSTLTQGGNLVTSYAYNIRSWQTQAVSPAFSQWLTYADGDSACYNGNISSMTWRNSASSGQQTYLFEYDKFNRLKKASHSATYGPLDYMEQPIYDANGNITSMSRTGRMGANSYIYSLVDGLNLTYSGNQLVSVSDAATGPNYAGAFHFIDGSSSAVEYEYDENGNMTRDLNKGIVSIEYNLLNLPQRVTLSTGDTARYVYDADGIKLSASYFTAMGGGVTGTYDTLNYCGNVIYRNGQLEQLLFDGGFITLSGTGTPQYHFYQCDHLGSVRTVTSQDGTIEHTNDYYPFGALFSVNPADNLQRWKYNGKELERMHGMNLMDYGARMYDPLLVRFTTMDPMCEKYYNVSPYAYCANNPVNAIDSDGRLVVFINGFYFTFWEKLENYWHTSKGNVNEMVMEHFHDKNVMYFDGSLGGILGIRLNSEDMSNSFCSTRYKYGLMEGQQSAKAIINQLTRDTQGNINEAIRIVTHSMGGAFAKGFAQALTDYARSHPVESEGLRISEYDFAPYQPSLQTAVKGVDTYQYSFEKDIIAGYRKMSGAHFMPTDNVGGHRLFNFVKFVVLLPEGNYIFSNGQFENIDNK